jgi:ribosomal-protein-alanine N-acetyltransferase
MTSVRFDIPTLQTERLTLRAPRMADFEAYAAFRGSERAVFLGGPYDEAQAFEQLSAIIGGWVLQGFGRWLVADRATDAPLGVVGLFHPRDWPEPEIAWSMFEQGEGKGYALEAALAARAHAYEQLGWTRVVSLIAPGNTRSEALAKRMGAQPEKLHHVPGLGDLMIWRHLSPGEVAA